MTPDADVVSNLYEVVELGTIPDARHTELAAINAGSGTKFHIITKLDRAHVRNATEPSPIRQGAEPEAVCSKAHQ